MLYFGSPAVYEIKTWRANRVTAIREHPCETALMTIDISTKEATVTSVRHADSEFCSKEPSNVWSKLRMAN
jgi:hypothetical protein